MVAVYDTLDHMHLIDIFRAFHSKAADYTFFSMAHRTFTRIISCLGLFPLKSLCNVLLSVLLQPWFKSLFCHIQVVLPSFFFFSICMKYHFHPFTFSLCLSFDLRWVSWRQHVYGSCLLIHSATICLLVGAFKSFTLKVIIDRYVFCVILLLDHFTLLFSFLLFFFFFLKQAL